MDITYRMPQSSKFMGVPNEAMRNLTWRMENDETQSIVSDDYMQTGWNPKC